VAAQPFGSWSLICCLDFLRGHKQAAPTAFFRGVSFCYGRASGRPRDFLGDNVFRQRGCREQAAEEFEPADHCAHWVNLGLNYGNNRSYTNEDILNRDSYTLGMAGQADIDQDRDVAPPSSDIRTAEFLGRRVAEVAQELSAGRAVLDRPTMRGVSGGADNQDPERARRGYP
jgi:hypothetical protein